MQPENKLTSFILSGDFFKALRQKGYQIKPQHFKAGVKKHDGEYFFQRRFRDHQRQLAAEKATDQKSYRHNEHHTHINESLVVIVNHGQNADGQQQQSQRGALRFFLGKP